MLYLSLYWTLVWYRENATPVRDRNHYAAIKQLLVPQILKNSFFWLIFKSFALGKYKLAEIPQITVYDNLPWKLKSQLSQTLQEPQITCLYLNILWNIYCIVLLFLFFFFLFSFLSLNCLMFWIPFNFGDYSLVPPLYKALCHLCHNAGQDCASQRWWDVLCNGQDSLFGLLNELW